MREDFPIRILVVDDEPSIRRSLAEFLEDYDFEVSHAESAEKGLKILDSNVCDIAIVDLRLPGMSGDSLVLRAHEKAPDMRFIIHTGSVGYRLSEELKLIGIHPEHVFLKPLPDLAVLVGAINKLMRGEVDEEAG